MAKDGTNRGGRRVRAGAKPDQLKDKLEAGKPASRLLEPADLDPFGLEDGDVGDGELFEGETMPPSTPTEQSLSRSTTDESVVRLHPLAPGAYDLGLLYLRSQSVLTPIIMYAIQVYRRYPPHNWNQ